MAKTISLFPTITDTLFKKMDFHILDFEFFYNDSSSRSYLEQDYLDDKETLFTLLDNNGLWNMDEFNLGLEFKCSISNPSILFGPKGVACSDAELGLGIVWTSSDSKQRGTFIIDSIMNTNISQSFSKTLLFDKAQLRGSVNFKVIIYLLNSGNPNIVEMHLANKTGLIVGEHNQYTLLLDGEGSEFPMYEVFEPKKPLWYINCNWVDPNCDSFQSSVAIYINKANPNYKYLDKSKKTFNNQLLVEILSSSYNIILNKLQEDSEWFANPQHMNLGSVADAIYYFINTSNWDISSPEKASETLRIELAKRIE